MSQKTAFLSEIASGNPIPAGKLAYFQERTRNNLYNFILTKFFEQERAKGLTKAELARRIGRSPEVITRLLGAPGNWTIATISDLLLGISGEELEAASSSVLGRSPRNSDTVDTLATSKTIDFMAVLKHQLSKDTQTPTSTSSHAAITIKRTQ